MAVGGRARSEGRCNTSTYVVLATGFGDSLCVGDGEYPPVRILTVDGKNIKDGLP
jgi:hypothetical protein